MGDLLYLPFCSQRRPNPAPGCVTRTWPLLLLTTAPACARPVSPEMTLPEPSSPPLSTASASKHFDIYIHPVYKLLYKSYTVLQCIFYTALQIGSFSNKCHVVKTIFLITSNFVYILMSTTFKYSVLNLNKIFN